MLLAESSGSFGFLFFLFIMVMGMRQWCIWLKGSPALRDGAKKGLFWVLGNLFKK